MTIKNKKVWLEKEIIKDKIISHYGQDFGINYILNDIDEAIGKAIEEGYKLGVKSKRKMKRTNKNKFFKLMRETSLINEIDNLCDLDLRQDYIIILIKDRIQKWREK